MLSRIIMNLTIVIVIILFSLPVIFKDQEDPVEASKKNPPEMNYTLTDVTLVGHSNGERQWQLRVQSVNDQGKDKAYLQGLREGELYQNGEIRYHLAASSGEYNRQLDEFQLKENVVVNGTQGETIKTQTVQYNNSAKKLVTSAVEIIDDDVHVQASKMAIDLDREIFEFSGGVEVKFTIGDDEEESEQPIEADQVMGGEEDAKKVEDGGNRAGHPVDDPDSGDRRRSQNQG